MQIIYVIKSLSLEAGGSKMITVIFQAGAKIFDF